MNTEYKKKLEEEKATLLGELNTLGKHDKNNNKWEATPEMASPAETADDNSNADRFEDYEEKTAAIIPLESRLEQVENALKKIAENTFGKCVVCGNKIESERLDANPAAETCIAHLEA